MHGSREHDVFVAAEQNRRSAWGAKHLVEHGKRIRPERRRAHVTLGRERDLAVGDSSELARQAVVHEEARRSAARRSAWVGGGPVRIGTLTSCSTPRACGRNVMISSTSSDVPLGSASDVASVPAEASTTPLGSVMTSRSALMILRNSGRRRWIVGRILASRRRP